VSRMEKKLQFEKIVFLKMHYFKSRTAILSNA
jgi:hypothetical protein